MRITVGGLETEGDVCLDGAHELGQLVVNDLDHDLLGPERLDDLHAQRFLHDVVAELAGHVEIDVGFEQGGADLAHGLAYIGLTDPTAPAQAAEYIAKLVTQRIEHSPGSVAARRRGSNAPWGGIPRLCEPRGLPQSVRAL